MKKFLIALLAALFVVCMCTVALADYDTGSYPIPADQPTNTPKPTDEPTPAPTANPTITPVPETAAPTVTPVPVTPDPDATVTPVPATAAPTITPLPTAVPTQVPSSSDKINYDGPAYVYVDGKCTHMDSKGNYTLEDKQVILEDGKTICTSRIALVRFCTNPNCTFEYTLDTRAPLGHDLDLKTTRTNPTTGKVEVQCTRCKEWVEQKTAGTGEIKANGDWSDWVILTPATCVSTGVKKRVNEENGKIEVALIDRLSKHTFDLSAATTYVVKRAGCVDADKDSKATKNAAQGCYSAVCLTCGATYEWNTGLQYGVCRKEGFVKTYTVEYGDGTTETIVPKYDDVDADHLRGTDVLKIAPRTHDWTAAVVTKEPTCLKDGEAKFACKNTNQTNIYNPCFATLIRVLDHNETVFDARVNATTKRYHNLVEVVEKKPTATEFGIHYYYCKTADCGYKTNELTYTTSTVTYNGQYDSTKAKGGAGTAAATTTKPTTGTKTTSSSTNKKGVSIPKTNDTTSNLPYVLIAVAFVGLVALVASKKKVNG